MNLVQWSRYKVKLALFLQIPTVSVQQAQILTHYTLWALSCYIVLFQNYIVSFPSSFETPALQVPGSQPT